MMDYILTVVGFISMVALARFQPRMLFKLGAPIAPEADPPIRDSEYYFHATTLVFRIQNTLFRVHENFLSFEENDLWSRIKLIRFLKKWLDGSSDDRAIALDDVPVAEFRALLDYFYHERTRNFTREAEIGYLQDLLAVSTRIKMVTIFEYASKRLENLQPPLSPHKRILLCQQYSLKLSTWLYPAVAELLEQVEPLNIDEAQQVGLELFQKIAAMREDLRQFRNEDGTFLFARGELTWYASNHLQWGTEDTLSAPLPAHRRITQ